MSSSSSPKSRKPHKSRPVLAISFYDLRRVGFEIDVQEFDKKIKVKGEDGLLKEINKPSVKINSVKRYGEPFPKAEMIEFLWILGIDTKEQRFWVVPKKQHRPHLTKIPQFDYRYMGYERIDREWLEGSRASDDVRAFTSRMKDMAEQLRVMRNGGERK